MTETPPAQRFLKLTQVQEILQISAAHSLVRSGDLPAIRIGDRNQWRVETSSSRNTNRMATGALPKLSRPGCRTKTALILMPKMGSVGWA